ncbi:hypothetical protein E2C01_065072 [Portunus trituberculatus]|uniref:Uncharacterized protein n=1 Tax=Portunus trituberculatus TaxID=210409 RepID=A0A5B7HHW7_PORTR|nr:hypothetical protein [Portunus trituberculatus]
MWSGGLCPRLPRQGKSSGHLTFTVLEGMEKGHVMVGDKKEEGADPISLPKVEYWLSVIVRFGISIVRFVPGIGGVRRGCVCRRLGGGGDS